MEWTKFRGHGKRPGHGIGQENRKSGQGRPDEAFEKAGSRHIERVECAGFVDYKGCKRIQQSQAARWTNTGTHPPKAFRMRGSPAWNARQEPGPNLRRQRSPSLGSS